MDDDKIFELAASLTFPEKKWLEICSKGSQSLGVLIEMLSPATNPIKTCIAKGLLWNDTSKNALHLTKLGEKVYEVLKRVNQVRAGLENSGTSRLPRNSE